MKQWSILIVILLLMGFTSTPSQPVILEGLMVGFYECEVSEISDLAHRNIVNLTLSICVNGANPGSPYYNCGVTERIKTAKCRIPEQSYSELHQLDTPLMYSKLSEEYRPEVGLWHCFRTVIVVTFSITLQRGENVVMFAVETETVVADSTPDSSQTTIVSESASFNYFVKTEYRSASILGSFSPGVFLAAVGVSVIIIVASTKMLPKETV